MGGKGSGGARLGAGRKPFDGIPRVKISARIPVEIINELERESEKLNISVSQVITKLLQKGLER